MSNKYLYNLKNVHYSIATVGADGALTYGEIKRLMGTTELTIELDQNSDKHYSEGLTYFVLNTSTGYKGELTIYNVPKEFEVDVLGFKEDSKKVLYENMNTQANQIALLFEIEGNEKAERHIMYRLQFSKPKMEYKTNTDKADVQVLKMSYEGLTDENGIGRAKTSKETDETVYNGWFSSVYKVK